MTDPYIIPRRLDDPELIGFWTIDEFAGMLVPFTWGILSQHIFIGIIVGLRRLVRAAKGKSRTRQLLGSPCRLLVSAGRAGSEGDAAFSLPPACRLRGEPMFADISHERQQSLLRQRNLFALTSAGLGIALVVANSLAATRDREVVLVPTLPKRSPSAAPGSRPTISSS
jgi:hypothetical protein